MTLDQARKRFSYTQAGKDWLEKKSQVTKNEKRSSAPFFQKPQNTGSHREPQGQQDVPLDTRNLRGQNSGDAHGYAACSLAELSLEGEFFLESNWQLYVFLLQARGENYMTIVGGSLVATHFFTRWGQQVLSNQSGVFWYKRGQQVGLSILVFNWITARVERCPNASLFRNIAHEEALPNIAEILLNGEGCACHAWLRSLPHRSHLLCAS